MQNTENEGPKERERERANEQRECDNESTRRDQIRETEPKQKSKEMQKA